MTRPSPGATVRTFAAALAIALGGALLAAPVSAATPTTVADRLASTVPHDPAGSLGEARARATALRKQLAALEVRQEAATEAYDAAESQLGTIVTRHLLAQRQLDDAKAEVSGATQTQADTARAIYRAGGTAALYATVLSGEDPTDVLSRIHAVETIVGGDHALIRAAQDVTARATAIETRLGALAKTQTRLELTVAAAAQRVNAAVARSRALLAAATGEVRRLAAAQAAAIDAQAAADAAAALDAARAAAIPGGPGDAPAPDENIVARAIAAARDELGKPYQWGATGPGTFDCSGLTGWAYGHAGVALPRTSREQWFSGPHPGLGYLEPGDLLFWATDPTNPATIHHVAIYLGNDEMIAAPHTGTVVQVQPVYLVGYIGAVRPTASPPAN